jgi:ferredoxin
MGTKSRETIYGASVRAAAELRSARKSGVPSSRVITTSPSIGLSCCSPVICSSCAARVHQGDNRTTASTTTLRTTVAIAATSMLEIRLVMRHFWRQSSDPLIWIKRFPAVRREREEEWR